MRTSYLVLLTCALGCPGPKGHDSVGDTSACVESTWYVDADGDGYGDPADPVTACEQAEGTVADNSDCDDTRALVYPGAEEMCADGVVNDCEAADDTAALDFCSGTGPFSLEGADAKLIGEEPEDRAGAVVAGGGDVNGDGRDDILVGAPYSSYGTIYLVSSPVGGLFDLGEANARLGDETAEEDGFGGALAGAGDVDGDGLADILTGAPWAARAYLMLGPLSGDVSVTSSDAWFVGDHGDDTGLSVAGPGDVDGDGLSDLLLGAPIANGLDEESEFGGCVAEDAEEPEHGIFAGAAYLFTGAPTGGHDASEADATLIGEDGGDLAGWRVARAGDLDGDGLADLFLSAPGNCQGGLSAGAAYVVLSPVGGDVYLGDADAKRYGEGGGTSAGDTISDAGDTNGDGTPDLLIGDPDKNISSSDYNAGTVYLFLGPVEGSRSVSRAEAKFVGTGKSHAGVSVSGVGDIDADGFDDIAIGAYGVDLAGDYAGATYVLRGPLSGAIDLAADAVSVFVGTEDSYSGEAVSGAGDTDGDALSDVLVGAKGDDTGGDFAGAAYLLLGGGALLSGDGEI